MRNSLPAPNWNGAGSSLPTRKTGRLRRARRETAGKHGLKPGKAWAGYAWRELHGRTLRRSGKEDAGHSLFLEECLFGFYGKHNSKIRKGSCRDVTWRDLVVTWRLIRDWSYLLTFRGTTLLLQLLKAIINQFNVVEMLTLSNVLIVNDGLYQYQFFPFFSCQTSLIHRLSELRTRFSIHGCMRFSMQVCNWFLIWNVHSIVKAKFESILQGFLHSILSFKTWIMFPMYLTFICSFNLPIFSNQISIHSFILVFTTVFILFFKLCCFRFFIHFVICWSIHCFSRCSQIFLPIVWHIFDSILVPCCIQSFHSIFNPTFHPCFQSIFYCIFLSICLSWFQLLFNSIFMHYWYTLWMILRSFSVCLPWFLCNRKSLRLSFGTFRHLPASVCECPSSTPPYPSFFHFFFCCLL